MESRLIPASDESLAAIHHGRCVVTHDGAFHDVHLRDVLQGWRQQGLTQSREVLEFLTDVFHYHTIQVSATKQSSNPTASNVATNQYSLSSILVPCPFLENEVKGQWNTAGLEVRYV